MPPIAIFCAFEAVGMTALAVAALVYAWRCRKDRDRERFLTNQFCFDSSAFSHLWQQELEANRPLPWPLPEPAPAVSGNEEEPF